MEHPFAGFGSIHLIGGVAWMEAGGAPELHSLSPRPVRHGPR